MIDEKKLIEELQALATSREIIEYTSAYDTVQDCIGIVEKQPQVDKWISVEEALPKTLIIGKPKSEEDYLKSRYLISNGEITHFAIWTQKGFRPIENVSTVIEDVIEWQPLPQPSQPYKQEDHLGEVNGMFQKPMTNADRIRNMTGEELEDFLKTFVICRICEHGKEENCGDNFGCTREMACKILHEWLQAEVKEGNSNENT